MNSRRRARRKRKECRGDRKGIEKKSETHTAEPEEANRKVSMDLSTTDKELRMHKTCPQCQVLGKMLNMKKCLLEIVIRKSSDIKKECQSKKPNQHVSLQLKKTILCENCHF